RSRAGPLRTAGSPCAAAVLGRGDAERPQPAQVQDGAGEVPLVAHLRHAAEDEATKAHRLLDLRVPAKDVPYARGPNCAAGRRGRRRSAYEAPRAAADRGTPPAGAESKRRRRPRLPAPPSRVTLLREVVGPVGRVEREGVRTTRRPARRRRSIAARGRRASAGAASRPVASAVPSRAR